jgi:hypothetical protein
MTQKIWKTQNFSSQPHLFLDIVIRNRIASWYPKTDFWSPVQGLKDQQ